EKYFENLQRLIPEASIRIAHGQMSERELELVMRDFYHQRFNFLLCTTIIESGIDIPTANTIIINRADRFGLAQLHQLRGRVGRSHHQAFAYLITPPRKALSGDAIKRLEAIESLEDLGAGFALASHDLEIRGAGELLGESQSGMIDEIGFTMYTEFLDRAIADLREGRTGKPEFSTASRNIEINLHVPALFPEDYLPDVHQRLVMYKRIANTHTAEQLQDLQAEIIDRFGLMPDAGRNLIKLAQLRIDLPKIGLKRIDLGEHGGSIEFVAQPDVDPAHMISLISEHPDRYKLRGTHLLTIKHPLPTVDARIEIVLDTVRSIAA
ncbi:MAG: TRCF domain-containing protein, partial [Saprospiraceae bacterium]|nr:TRCF domain-containing protein [Saprospiraceae bacterium]